MHHLIISLFCKKVTIYNLRIIFKRYAHFQTMTLTPVKFQRSRHKTVGDLRVALARCPLLEEERKDRKKEGWNTKYVGTIIRVPLK